MLLPVCHPDRSELASEVEGSRQLKLKHTRSLDSVAGSLARDDDRKWLAQLALSPFATLRINSANGVGMTWGNGAGLELLRMEHL